MNVKEEDGTFWCIDCFLTEMANIQGYALCPYCENATEI